MKDNLITSVRNVTKLLEDVTFSLNTSQESMRKNWTKTICPMRLSFRRSWHSQTTPLCCPQGKNLPQMFFLQRSFQTIDPFQKTLELSWHRLMRCSRVRTHSLYLRTIQLSSWPITISSAPKCNRKALHHHKQHAKLRCLTLRKF